MFLILAALAFLYFAVLMFFAVRTVFGVDNGAAAGMVALSWIPLAAFAFSGDRCGFLFRMLASPFFLFYLIYYLGSEFRGLGDGLRSSQNYRRMLEAAAVNPHDGEAQYQLGLIHQQRRQYTEAIRRFQAAVAIDPTETDAHFQLGRIANEQGRYEEALRHLEDRPAPGRKAQLERGPPRARQRLPVAGPSWKRPAANSLSTPSAASTIPKDCSTTASVLRADRQSRRTRRTLRTRRGGCENGSPLPPPLHRQMEPPRPEASGQAVATGHTSGSNSCRCSISCDGKNGFFRKRIRARPVWPPAAPCSARR